MTSHDTTNNEHLDQQQEQDTVEDNDPGYYGEDVENPIASYIRDASEADREQINEDLGEESETKVTQWELQNKRYKLIHVLEIWKEVQSHDRQMKTLVAKVIFGLLVGEMAVAAIAFFLIGFGLIEFEAWIGEIFIVSIIAQIFGVATIVVHSLFPKPNSDTLTELNKIVDKL